MTRQEKIEILLNKWVDAMDLDDLIAFYKDRTETYLSTKTDELIDLEYKNEMGDQA